MHASICYNLQVKMQVDSVNLARCMLQLAYSKYQIYSISTNPSHRSTSKMFWTVVVSLSHQPSNAKSRTV